MSQECIDLSKIWIVLDQLHLIPYWTKKLGELWSTNQKVIDAHVEPPNWTFWETIIRPFGGAGPSNFYTPYNSLKCISSRVWGAGRPHVGLCPIFLVFYILALESLVGPSWNKLSRYRSMTDCHHGPHTFTIFQVFQNLSTLSTQPVTNHHEWPWTMFRT